MYFNLWNKMEIKSFLVLLKVKEAVKLSFYSPDCKNLTSFRFRRITQTGLHEVPDLSFLPVENVMHLLWVVNFLRNLEKKCYIKRLKFIQSIKKLIFYYRQIILIKFANQTESVVVLKYLKVWRHVNWVKICCKL